jgi:hypothetical protein
MIISGMVLWISWTDKRMEDLQAEDDLAASAKPPEGLSWSAKWPIKELHHGGMVWNWAGLCRCNALAFARFVSGPMTDTSPYRGRAAARFIT